MNIFLDQIITPSKVFKNFKIKFMEGKGFNPQNLLSKQNFYFFLKNMHLFSQFLKQALNVYSTMARTYPCNLSLKTVTSTIQLHNSWGELPSGLRHCSKNQKVPGSKPTRCSAGLRDPTSLRLPVTFRSKM